MDDVYSYAYKQGLRINKAYENPLIDLSLKDGFKLLYHGSKNGIDGEINLEDLNNSEAQNGTKYSPDALYWMGYIYRYWSYVYEISSKSLY